MLTVKIFDLCKVTSSEGPKVGAGMFLDYLLAWKTLISYSKMKCPWVFPSYMSGDE